MCGITGVVSNNSIDLSSIQKMNTKLLHRGPDSYGYLCTKETINTHVTDKMYYLKHYNHANFAFGHRRLAIHDVSSDGDQPMSYRDRYWIVFNGEIFNFIELKVELEEKGYLFNSSTDTEIIMAAYDYWGVDCLNKFNGDWVFVLVDLYKNKIFISRDRFGVKPLYYFAKPGLFVFGSEIKAILEHPEVTKEPNIDYLMDFVKNGQNEYSKETAFKDIYRFDFASYVEEDLRSFLHRDNLNFKKFWALTANLSAEPLNEKKLEEYAKQYYAMLEQSVKIRLRSDVKIGMSLSGGLDSSSILYLINEQQGKDVTQKMEAFSSVYQTPGTQDCDESVLISEIATLLDVKSNQTEPKEEDVPAEHRKMIYYLDTPPDSTLMSSWYTAKLESEYGIRVTLSGEGADEQLAGYLRYITYYFSNIRLRDILKNYRAFKSISGVQIYLWTGIVANCAKRLFGKNITQSLYKKTRRKEQIFTPVNEKLKQDIFGCLVTLHHVDERAFMAHSIELRAPFMDYLLVEFLASLPVTYKLARGWTKYLARYSFDGLLPKTINWNKIKKGWPVPESYWFQGKLKSWLDNTIETSAFLKQHQFYSTYKSNKVSLVLKIRLLNIAIWHDVFFNNKED